MVVAAFHPFDRRSPATVAGRALDPANSRIPGPTRARILGMSVRTKLTVAYLGGGFSGWQRQRVGRTVQGELERALDRLTDGRRAAVIGAGRTDAGVHAAAQVAHVDLRVAIPPEVLPKALNAHLAPDLRVRSADTVWPSFHAQKSSVGKHYAYRIRWCEPSLPWLGLRSAVLAPIIDFEALEAACRLMPGRRDWSSFTVPEAARKGAVRTVYRVEPVLRRDGLDIHVWGEGFLRYQVRRMVGAAVAAGRRRLTIGDLEDLLASPSPGAPVLTAPAQGLTLERVYYHRVAGFSFRREPC
jgi:tRNA pseudouridine38-40 synthase